MFAARHRLPLSAVYLTVPALPGYRHGVPGDVAPLAYAEPFRHCVRTLTFGDRMDTVMTVTL